MAYEVIYGVNKLHDYMTILNVERTILPPRTNYTKNIPSIHGEYYTGYKYAPRKISLECVFFADTKEEYMETVSHIAFLLDSTMPTRMEISDAKDKHCYAVLDGEVSIDKIKQNATFTLEFICYDPMCYSNDIQLYNEKEEDSIKVFNGGTADAYPVLNLEFSQDCYFASCSLGSKVVLIGAPYSVEDTLRPADTVVLKDTCETLEGWGPVSNVVDNAEIIGNLSINSGGYAIYCNEYGSAENKWHGGGGRKELKYPVKDFEVKIRFEHNSWGDLKGVGSGSTPPVSSAQYKVTADPSLRIREGRGTEYKKIGSIPKGTIVTVTDIQKNWGKVTYNGVTGYIHMDYVVKYTEPNNSSQNGTYQTTNPLNVRSGRGTNYKIVTGMPQNYKVAVSDIQNGWGKVTYKGVTGYSSMQYLKKVSSTRDNMRNTEEEKPSAENKIGQIQVLGFDKHGNRLFITQMIDAEKWYEYSEPKMYIGSKLVLDDGSKCPTPVQKSIKDDEGKQIRVEDTHSGKFGDWNDAEGIFKITRRTENGKQMWQCEVQKLTKEGTVARKLQTNVLNSSTYPTGDLSNIVIFFGQYGSDPVVDCMLISDIEITDLGEPTPPEVRKPIFKPGQKLKIDLARQEITLDEEVYLNHLDIGSEFFTVPTGSSKIFIKSDDTKVDVEVGIVERWL